MYVSQFSSKKEKIMLHLKIVFKDCQSVNYCNFLKRWLVKEVFFVQNWFDGFTLQLWADMTIIKIYLRCPLFQEGNSMMPSYTWKISFICKLFSDHDEGYQAKIKSLENNKSCKNWNFQCHPALLSVFKII